MTPRRNGERKRLKKTEKEQKRFEQVSLRVVLVVVVVSVV